MIIKTLAIKIENALNAQATNPYANIDNPTTSIVTVTPPAKEKPDLAKKIQQAITTLEESTKVSYVVPQIVPARYSPTKAKDLAGSIDLLSATTKKYEPYELLVGISQDRPEIIALTDFWPLVDEFSNKTSEFLYFDAQVFMRSLKQENIKKLIDLVTTDSQISQDIGIKTSRFNSSITTLKDISSSVLGVVQNIEKLKQQLNIRNDQKNVNVQVAIDRYVQQYATGRSLASFVTSTHPENYDISDVLVTLGYDQNSVKTIFSSTKIWMQLMFEMKNIIKYHSLDFLELTNTQNTTDISPVLITKTNITRFALNNKQPALIKLSSIKDVQPEKIVSAISILSTAFDELYTDVKFSSEDIKLAALLNTVSKEYRYSKGLSEQSTKNALINYYSYSVTDAENPTVFDSVIGQFGNTIADVSSIANKSLVSISQQPVATTTVLTFENKYIDGSNGTLTPGSTYYVDSLLKTIDGKKYETSKLVDLNSILDNAYNEFSVIAHGLNLVIDDPQPTNISLLGSKELLSNPKAMLEKIMTVIVDNNGKSLQLITNDAMASIFTYASTNTNFKSMLFLYFLTKISRSYSVDVPFFSTGISNDNITTIYKLVDDMIDLLVRDFDSKQVSQNIHSNDEINYVSVSSLRNTLKYPTNSKLIKFVSDLMSSVITEFQVNDEAFTKDASRYGGHLDTAVVMAFFDIIITSIKLCGKQQFLRKDTDQSQGERFVYFQQQTTSKTTKNLVNGIRNRLVKEISLTQQLIFTTLSTFDNLVNSTRNVLNYVDNANSVDALTKITAMLGNNKDLLNFFLSEEQIMLFVSSISDIKLNLLQQGTSKIETLDKTVISKKLRDTLFNFFSGQQYKIPKKIATVGLPVGFTKRLQQRLDVKSANKSSFQSKQQDIINICVYKIDLENPMLVFKPIKHPFELSRFPIRCDTPLKQSSSVFGFSEQDVLATVPMRDLSATEQIEYYPAQKTDKQAFDSEEYSFLTPEQKSFLHKNHVTSYMLETYINIMTGLQLCESDFYMSNAKLVVDQKLVKSIIQKQISTIVAKKQAILNKTQAENVLFDTKQITVSISSQNIPDAQSLLSTQDLSVAVQSFVTISDLINTLTSLTDTNILSSTLVCPKKFDRVFNVIIDSNEFEIDYDMTVSTQSGKSVLENLIAKNNVVVQQTQDASITPKYFTKVKTRTQGDIVFDKYFVTIETLGDTI